MSEQNPSRAEFIRDFVKKLVFGLVIGIACITPGLSGGVLAAAAGLYEPALRAIVRLRKEFKKGVLYLLPLGLGGGAGVLLFSRAMKGLMDNAQFGVLYVFLGLVAGSIPSLFGEAHEKGFRKQYLLAAFLPFVAVLLLERSFPGVHGAGEMGWPFIILYGGVLAIGTVIPGISSSFILMNLGVYESLLDAIVAFDLRVMALLGIGAVVTGLLIIKVVEYFFRRFRGFSYYAVIGFLLGSMAMVFPGLRTGWGLVLDLFLFFASTALSWWVMRLQKKNAAAEG